MLTTANMFLKQQFILLRNITHFLKNIQTNKQSRPTKNACGKRARLKKRIYHKQEHFSNNKKHVCETAATGQGSNNNMTTTTIPSQQKKRLRHQGGQKFTPTKKTTKYGRRLDRLWFWRWRRVSHQARMTFEKHVWIYTFINKKRPS